MGAQEEENTMNLSIANMWVSPGRGGLGIRKVNNGYVVTDTRGTEHVFRNLDEALGFMLLHFEGRASSFRGNSFGRVVIQREQ